MVCLDLEPTIVIVIVIIESQVIEIELRYHYVHVLVPALTGALLHQILEEAIIDEIDFLVSYIQIIWG